MKVSFPGSVTAQISQRAAIIAQGEAVSRGWKSAAAIQAISNTGYVGLKTTKKYHLYQELGTKPFLMRSLEGKTVPIKDASGLHFVKVVGVGQPGWVTLPGGVRKWRDQKWRHPGIKPTNMMGRAIRQAMREERAEVIKMMQRLVGLDVT